MYTRVTNEYPSGGHARQNTTLGKGSLTQGSSSYPPFTVSVSSIILIQVRVRVRVVTIRIVSVSSTIIIQSIPMQTRTTRMLTNNAFPFSSDIFMHLVWNYTNNNGKFC